MPTAFVLIKCEKGDDPGLIRKLLGTYGIREVQPTVGHYDLIARITSPSLEHLNEIIEKIHGNNKIRSTKILLGMNETVEAA